VSATTPAKTNPLPPTLSNMRVEMSVRIGTSMMSLKELVALEAGTLITLEESADRPLELLANGHVIARGELEETEDGKGLGLRITETVASEAAWYG